MGAELHITRNQFWAEDENPILKQEWIDLIENDPELEWDKLNEDAIWNGNSRYDPSSLSWFQGNISTKWPDTALYEKMLKIASMLNARVQDDDGTIYPDEAQWEYTPR